MKVLKSNKNCLVKILIFLFLAIVPLNILQAQQKIVFGIHADPVISWFSTDIKEVHNVGARPGFCFGLTYNKYFTSNYSFSTGISLLNAGGRLVNKDTTVMEFTNFKSTVLPGNPVVYKIRYLVFPIGLKLQTNQIGYLTFFSDLGLDPKIVIGGKADIPSLNITNEKAMNELRMFNLSYHFTAGIEYSLGGTTALVFGLNFDNNFLDITKDNGNQPVDKVSHKILSFRLGVNF
ncbi:MAG: porin family protein [Bacteroidales bacterium]|jgi:hypothetical protein